MTLSLCLLIFLPKILYGAALAHCMWRDSDVAAIGLKLAVGVPLGFAISSSLFFAALVVGITPKHYSQAEFWGFLLLAILIVLRILSKLPRKAWRFVVPSRTIIFGGTILILAFGLLTYAFLYYARLHPYGFEDAWSIWNYMPRYLYRSNSADILFNSRFYEPFHPDYPLGLGLNVAWGWFVLQRESTSLPIAIGLYAILSPAFMLWTALQKWRAALPAMLATLVYLMNPNLKWAVGQMADLWLALYFLAAIVMLYGYLRSSEAGLLVLAGLLGGFAAWIKNEGILFAGVLLLIFVVMGWRRMIPRGAIKRLLAGMIPPVFVVSLYKLAVHAPSDLFRSDRSMMIQILNIQRWWIIAKEFLLSMLRHGDWPISVIVVLAAYGLLVGFDRAERPYQIWLLLLIVGQLIGYFGIYLITPHDLDWHLSTSVDRVISHLFPMAFFWLFLTLKPPFLVESNRSTA